MTYYRVVSLIAAASCGRHATRGEWVWALVMASVAIYCAWNDSRERV